MYKGEWLPEPSFRLIPPLLFKYCYHRFPAEGIDYNIAEFVEYVNGFPLFTLTLLPGATEACFDVSIVDDDEFGGENEIPVEQVTFLYFSSSPTVVEVDIDHTLVILDNDRKG